MQKADSMIEISERLTETIRGMYGEQGPEWLRRLPELAHEIAGEWELTLEPPFPNVPYHYVAPARRANGDAVVLKIGPHPEMHYEAAALRLWNGDGCARLLEHDTVRNALLIERIFPATTLASLIKDNATDAVATTFACNAFRSLPRLPAPEGVSFPTIADWFEALPKHRALYEGTGPIPEVLFREAEVLAADLLASSGPQIVIHGDFHQYNILQCDNSGENWIAIDPHGVLGEPEYEIGALLLNPNGHFFSLGNVQELTRRRLDQCASEMGFDRERLRAWGIARSVLSACWSLEDGAGGGPTEGDPEGWRYDIAIAELIRKC